jgi:hypothetical protein
MTSVPQFRTLQVNQQVICWIRNVSPSMVASHDNELKEAVAALTTTNVLTGGANHPVKH